MQYLLIHILMVCCFVDGEPLDHPTASDEPSIMYYVNDGVYGSFNCLLFDHATVTANTMKVGSHSVLL